MNEPIPAPEESALQKSLYRLNDNVAALEKLVTAFEDKLGRLLRPTASCPKEEAKCEQSQTSSAVSELDSACLRLLNARHGLADILDRYEG